jgi:two-component system, NtrC family, response regulator AtoC
VVDDDVAQCDFLKEELEREGYSVEVANGGRPGIERVKRGGIDLVVSDVKMPDLDGLDLLREIRAVEPCPYVITVTGFGSIDTAIRAVKLGAYDYLTKPFETEHLLLTIKKALSERSLRSEVVRLREEVTRRDRLDNIIGRSPAMQEIFSLIRRVAGSQASVLITGDSGTGKELVARAIHAHGPRKARPFVAITARPSPRRCWKASSSATPAGPTRPRAPIATACSSKPTAALCFWMKSPTCRCTYSPSCCASCRTASCARLAPTRRSRWTFGS